VPRAYAIDAGSISCRRAVRRAEHRRVLAHAHRSAGLAAGVQMAVEFRHRGWLAEGAVLEETLGLLRTLGVSLIAADDLLHEMQQPDRAQTGLPPGSAAAERLPVTLQVTDGRAAYVRVHRRQGKDRLLGDDEMRAYVERLRASRMHDALGLRGPIFFLWGNSWLGASRPLAPRDRCECRRLCSCQNAGVMRPPTPV
jgi:hypothetical protein